MDPLQPQPMGFLDGSQFDVQGNPQNQIAQQSLVQPASPVLPPPTPIKVNPSPVVNTDQLQQTPKTTFDIQSALMENMNKRNQTLQQLSSAFTPNAEEQQLGTDLNNLQTEAKNFQLDNQDQIARLGVQRGVTTAVASAQQAEQSRQANIKLSRYAIQEQGLTGKLQLAQSKRQSQIDALKLQLETEKGDDQTLIQLAQLQRQQEQDLVARADKLSDNARQTLNTLITNFGGLAFEDLNPQTQEQMAQLAAQAGVPEGLLRSGLQTIKDKQLIAQKEKQDADMQMKMLQFEALQEQRDTTNAFRAASIGIQQSNAQIMQQMNQLKLLELQNQFGGAADNVMAFAQQYASDGKRPTSLPPGVSFGQVSQVAKELPKPPGSLVDRNTGVKPSTLSATQEDGITASVDLLKKLDDANALFKEYNHGILPGLKNSILPSKTSQQYNGLKNEIVDLLARARTGAVINEEEQRNYNGKLPGNFSKSLFLGKGGEQSIKDLKASLEGKLQAALKTNGLAIYGYSTVKGPDGRDYKVGDTIKNGQGQVGMILPDGSISLMQ